MKPTDLPPDRFTEPIPTHTLASLCAALSGETYDEWAWRWLEKARRFAELNRGRLIDKCLSRGMSTEAAAELCEQIAEILVLAGSFSTSGQRAPDPASLSAALVLLDGDDVSPQVAEGLRGRVDPMLESLPAKLRSREKPWLDVAPPAAELLDSLYRVDQPDRWPQFAATPRPEGSARVVIFSPNPYSLYTLSVMAMLLARGIEISGLVVRSMWSFKRVSEELNYGRHRLVSKVVRKLILKTDESAVQSGYSMRELCDDIGVEHRSAIRWAMELDIPVATVPDLNSPEAHRSLQTMRPDYCLFTGGGLVKRSTLSLCGAGLLACHPGIVPQYRGIDVAHWPLMDGHPEQIGATVYIMDEGVDTGEVLGQMFIDPTPFDDHGSLRNDLVSLKSIFLVDVLERLIANRIEPETQPEVGRLYFSMHKSLEDMMDVAVQ